MGETCSSARGLPDVGRTCVFRRVVRSRPFHTLCSAMLDDGFGVWGVPVFAGYVPAECCLRARRRGGECVSVRLPLWFVCFEFARQLSLHLLPHPCTYSPWCLHVVPSPLTDCGSTAAAVSVAKGELGGMCCCQCVWDTPAHAVWLPVTHIPPVACIRGWLLVRHACASVPAPAWLFTPFMCAPVCGLIRQGSVLYTWHSKPCGLASVCRCCRDAPYAPSSLACAGNTRHHHKEHQNRMCCVAGLVLALDPFWRCGTASFQVPASWSEAVS